MEALKSKATTTDEVQLINPLDVQLSVSAYFLIALMFILQMSSAANLLKLASLVGSESGLLRESREILIRYWSHMKKSEGVSSNSLSDNKLSALAALVRKSKMEPTSPTPSPTSKNPGLSIGLEYSQEYSRVNPICQYSSLTDRTLVLQPRGVKRAASTQLPVVSKQAKTRFGTSKPVNQPQSTDPESTSVNVVTKTSDERLHIDGVHLFGTLIKLFRSLLQSDSAKFIYWPKEQRLRYVCLDIDSDLQRIIKDARTFIMVGGTM